MFFAFADYLHYLYRRGRFARHPDTSIMTGAFEGSLSPQVLAVLRPGDLIFVETLDWSPSWLIMYLTSSEISHVAIYVGNGEVVHATLDGVRTDPITSLQGNARLLPCIWPMPDEKRLEVAEMLRISFEGVPYGWAAVRLKAWRILSGRDWPYFHWKFCADIAIFVFAADTPLFLLMGHPVLTFLLPLYLILVLFNALRWRVSPLQFSEWTGKPVDILRMLQANGGHFVVDAYSLRMHIESIKNAVA